MTSLSQEPLLYTTPNLKRVVTPPCEIYGTFSTDGGRWSVRFFAPSFSYTATKLSAERFLDVCLASVGHRVHRFLLHVQLLYINDRSRAKGSPGSTSQQPSRSVSGPDGCD